MRRNHGHTRQRIGSIIAIGALLAMLGVSVAVPMLPTARAATTWNVYVNNNYFVPKMLEIQVGDTVVWTSNVSMLHTVTSNSSEWTPMEFNSVGATGSHAFMSPGVFDYICIYHFSTNNMWGRIVVDGAIPEFSGPLVVVASMMAIFAGMFIIRDRRGQE